MRAVALLLASSAAAAAAPPVPLPVSVSSGAAPAHRTAREYVSYNLDLHYDGEEWPAWRAASYLNMSLAEPSLAYLAAALAAEAPSHLRLGGSEGDLAVYVLPGFPCALPPEQNATANPVPFCLDAGRWASLHAFAAAAGNTSIAFGLNAMRGRAAPGARADLRNAAAFIAATAAAGYRAGPGGTLAALEFGNELEYKAQPAAYAADLVAVAALVAAAWPDAAVRPRLVANDENPDPSYWAAFLPLVPAGTLAAATWHQYTGYGLDPDLPTKALDAAFLDGAAHTAATQVAAANAAGFAGDIWVGETALAWHSGRDNTTNAFASTFWYLIQLGALAATHTVQCRQTLLGGYYELIDKTTRTPNPDYWLATLWKRTMGTGVLAAAFTPAAAPQLRLFAHCAAPGSGTAPGKGVTLAFANLSPDTAYALNVTGGGGAAMAAPRLEYHLAAPNGDMTSRTALLNGAPLTYGGPGLLDPATPLAVNDPAAPIVVQPRTNGFIVFTEATNMC